MSARDIELRTCSGSLFSPGTCCYGTCSAAATAAVIYADLVEHARCTLHDHDDAVVAKKPLHWSPVWGPR